MGNKFVAGRDATIEVARHINIQPEDLKSSGCGGRLAEHHESLSIVEPSFNEQ